MIPRPWPVTMLPFGKRPRKLPVVLGAEDVQRLWECARPLKQRVILSTFDAAGLRLEEALHRTAADIDSTRMLDLARYVAGAAIGDSRWLAHEQGRVTFRVKDYRQGRKRATLTLAGEEFVRRFCLHVLPQGLVWVRYFGLLASTQRQRLIPQCRPAGSGEAWADASGDGIGARGVLAARRFRTIAVVE